jgi:hypothetical protein
LADDRAGADPGTLPADWHDSYYVGSDGVHVLTRHLTEFTLLIDDQAPTAPTDVAGTVTDGSLTLTWSQGVGNGSVKVSVLVDGGRLPAAVSRRLRLVTRVIASTSGSAFSPVAAPRRNVQLVVRDVARARLKPIRALHSSSRTSASSR